MATSKNPFLNLYPVDNISSDFPSWQFNNLLGLVRPSHSQEFKS